MDASRTVGWEGFFNTRDLGGLPTRPGPLTSHGAFFRSADLRFVTEAGWSQAREAGLRTVVDLRNAAEIRPTAESSATPAGSARFTAAAGTTAPSGITRVEIPLDDVEDVELWQHISDEHLDGSPLYYRVFLERKPERCAALITALARTDPGGVLFHCGSGRDRAGLVSLMLLGLARVEPEAIAADYELSTEGVRPLYATLGVEDQGPLIESMLAEHGTTRREAVLRTLDGFDAEKYLLDAGVSSADLENLRSRLVMVSG
ncbi:tyrosine-protein phosphatase [Amycolatopsis saalfeldensis]|uniref:tyrosine-protein phosphatase n=1 Tax=Amycolatopsis saalfeldensis TaxID=394193 RepID=UPI000B86EBB8|nr:tyrosine-protein phosphatase [Amycolatopsis saalfeldensis]